MKGIQNFQLLSSTTNIYVVIIAVVLFSQISRVGPRENFHFNLCLFIVMKTSENHEFPHLVQHHKNICAQKLWCIQYFLPNTLHSTVGPRLSGHQLSGYLYYPATILQYIFYCLFPTTDFTVLLKTKTK